MISIKEFLELVDYRITEGSDYGWQCFGHNTYRLDSWNGDQDGHSFSIIFDTITQVVYQVEAHDYSRQRAYRFTNPEYKDSHDNEANGRGVNKDEAWDDVNYVDLEVKEDWLEKARAIFSDVEYDTRVQVPVDFSDEELLQYMKLAHDRDITFNQLVEEALQLAINEQKKGKK